MLYWQAVSREFQLSLISAYECGEKFVGSLLRPNITQTCFRITEDKTSYLKRVTTEVMKSNCCQCEPVPISKQVNKRKEKPHYKISIN